MTPTAAEITLFSIESALAGRGEEQSNADKEQSDMTTNR
jgi:hypothetical protein